MNKNTILLTVIMICLLCRGWVVAYDILYIKKMNLLNIFTFIAVLLWFIIAAYGVAN